VGNLEIEVPHQLTKTPRGSPSGVFCFFACLCANLLRAKVSFSGSQLELFGIQPHAISPREVQRSFSLPGIRARDRIFVDFAVVMATARAEAGLD
jgi:hypothetical protein